MQGPVVIHPLGYHRVARTTIFNTPCVHRYTMSKPLEKCRNAGCEALRADAYGAMCLACKAVSCHRIRVTAMIAQPEDGCASRAQSLTRSRSVERAARDEAP